MKRLLLALGVACAILGGCNHDAAGPPIAASPTASATPTATATARPTPAGFALDNPAPKLVFAGLPSNLWVVYAGFHAPAQGRVQAFSQPDNGAPVLVADYEAAGDSSANGPLYPGAVATYTFWAVFTPDGGTPVKSVVYTIRSPYL